MSKLQGHKHTGSITQNQKAHLANAYNELGKELSSHKMRVIGNYTLGRVIGEGAYGKVRIGTHRLTSARVAIKQIPKSMSASLTREIHHHRQLHHPHVTQMYEVIATESSIWIVTELCSGGELFDYLTEKGRLSEDETRFLFGQLCLAVAYLHEKGIVHRDLKLENVLLDERCRVKLGDFGFTREFERGVLMDTFCGTTGYASPEMLQGKKYLGAEVDIWSLGVILYVLLTGMLPFDDDDEQIMRDKVILGEFEDPEWLSEDARDLMKNILQKEPSKRLTIPQILEHPWFTSNIANDPNTIVVREPRSWAIRPSPGPLTHDIADSALSSEASTTESSVGSHAELGTSAPTTPDHSVSDSFEDNKLITTFHSNQSETTIRKSADNETKHTLHHPETVTEEGQDEDIALNIPLSLQRQRTNSSGRSAAPPVHTVRTPARTKRRSVSSTLSNPEHDHDSSMEKTSTLPLPEKDTDLNFSSLLITPAPIIFSTPLERELLNMMNLLGFDLGQTVYSVLNDACDSAGAVWWMLKRKAEKKLLEEGTDSLFSGIGADSTLSPTVDEHLGKYRPSKRKKHNIGIQTDNTPQPLDLSRTAPQLAFVPATPTFPPRPSTPPRPVSPSPSRSPMLTPSSSVVIDASKSHPTTPGSSNGSKGRKNRAGSVSIMQRATTALEAAGLVRKKSSEAVREEREKDKEKEREIERKNERKMTGGSTEERPRSSHGSVSSWRKSPPLRPSKDPSTPPPSELHHPQPHMGSPWVLADTRDSPPSQSGSNASRIAPTPANSPGATDPFASPENGGTNNNSVSKSSTSSHRNRANLLTAFRLWFQEDRKGKRKENRGGNTSLRASGGSANVKRRTSSGNSVNQVTGRRVGRRPQRPSMSSRRSSSVNSRTSITSVQMVLLDSPQVAGRRSFGSHTPNSDRADFAPNSSRPSSIRSLSNQQRHRKSPSVSSTGSVHYRATSPMQSRYHRRGGSGSSSTTRVVRQPGTPSNTGRSTHVRSNSAASSIHSPPSSRPTSFIEYNSDYEGGGGLVRTSSPYKIRRSFEETTPRRPGTTFVAQKRQGPFASPLHSHGYGGSVGRSSWKKAWGLEPPGWRTRGAQAVEVLTISPSEGTSLRDVFSGPGRLSLSLGDESDWVDEDDDIPYAAGLGQMTLISSSAGSGNSGTSSTGESTVLLGPAPRRPSTNTGKRGNKGRKVSPGERTSPVANDIYEIPESRGGRRQLPAGRSSGPAFKQIMEEDEEEEEV
ncbi:Pkinase-domain-containing protein [Lentinula detonsa]|uniref:Pkinase-domain-containing protein n=1 Tax=Lentinula detonsa TaxID=2804962 RepID=A0A9W8NQ31_9AGAR|nr:Pkinase-domain-containing protein [Lentinula detonsa]KAJ3979386.1 Pkinase-domain-containing protein [Lentinula detonsa]